MSFPNYIKHPELGGKGYIWQRNLGLRFGKAVAQNFKKAREYMMQE